jgi:hypothetical protein
MSCFHGNAYLAEEFGVACSVAWHWLQQIIAILREAVRDKHEAE